MKFLFQKPLLFPQRPETCSPGIQWQGKFKLRTITPAILRLLEKIKGIGFTENMDDYEKRKLGIFNQLNFFQLLTGIVIPSWGLIRHHQLPVMAWIVAGIPAFVSVLVLVLNARREYYLAQIAYFGLYPVATSFVYFWG